MRFFPMCVDVATMMPMIEMASTHACFIDEILYIYNDANHLSFFQERRKQQEEIEAYIRNQKPYAPLSHRDWIKRE